jgi:hypothetical protein
MILRNAACMHLGSLVLRQYQLLCLWKTLAGCKGTCVSSLLPVNATVLLCLYLRRRRC